MNLVNAVEEVKEKLSSKEYKDILDSAMKIHNASSSNNIDVHAEIHGVYVEALHNIMEAIGGYNMIGLRNVARPSRVPRVVEIMVDDIEQYKKENKVYQAKQDWYDGCIAGFVDTYDLEGLFKEAENDEDVEKALFYIYLYRYEEMPQEYGHRAYDLFSWDMWGCHYGSYNQSHITESTTIDELWDKMYTCREQHYLTYDFLEAISVY